MRDIIPNLSGPNVTPGSIVIDTNLDSIFTLAPLSEYNYQHPISGSSSQSQHGIRFTNRPVDTDLISTLRVDIVIKYRGHLDINPNNYSPGLLGAVLHHELMIQMMRCGAVYYTVTDLPRRSAERLDLISCHLLGISLSGARRFSNNKAFVVVNCTHSYITQTHKLIDLMATFVAGRPIESVPIYHHFQGPYEQLLRYLSPELAMISANDESFQEFRNILTGYKCSAFDYRGKEVILRFTITVEPASHLFVDRRTTVLDFYYRLGVTINYPNLPCLKSRSADHPYYPLEMCWLLAEQKVPIFRLSTSAKTHLVQMNKPYPNVSRRTSMKARDDIASLNRDQFNAFGLQLSREPLEAVGCTLNKPALEYKNQVLSPTRDYWESGLFYRPTDLMNNWCVVDTVGVNSNALMSFMSNFCEFSAKFGFRMSRPHKIDKSKQEIMDHADCLDDLIRMCSSVTNRELRFVMFIIDSNSTKLNRMIHLTFDDHPTVTATCLRQCSVMNQRQHRSIYRTLIHKLNARLGGTNLIYNRDTWEQLDMDSGEIMVVGLDVTHPDNELSGVSIVGCAYTYCKDLFRHKSLVWPQTARKEIIDRMGPLMERLISDYQHENDRLPRHILVYRDGVSHEEFDKVRVHEITKAAEVIEYISSKTKEPKPKISYIIAQKRHTMRFYRKALGDSVDNPPGGTLINRGIFHQEGREFYLYSNANPTATARPLHYHVLVNGISLDVLQKLTYYLCFNFGKCSNSLSMPSSLRYAHNAAYDARNRVIACREFSENKFYTTKFFC